MSYGYCRRDMGTNIQRYTCAISIHKPCCTNSDISVAQRPKDTNRGEPLRSPGSRHQETWKDLRRYWIGRSVIMVGKKTPEMQRSLSKFQHYYSQSLSFKIGNETKIAGQHHSSSSTGWGPWSPTFPCPPPPRRPAPRNASCLANSENLLIGIPVPWKIEKTIIIWGWRMYISTDGKSVYDVCVFLSFLSFPTGRNDQAGSSLFPTMTSTPVCGT